MGRNINIYSYSLREMCVWGGGRKHRGKEYILRIGLFV